MKASVIALLFSVSASAQTLCPDGTYVGGDCTLAPDGTYVGSPRDEPRFPHYAAPMLPRTVIVAAQDDDSEQYQARTECEEEVLPDILRTATTRDLFYPYTEEELAFFKELGILDDLGIEPPEPTPGLSESDMKEMDSLVIETLIADHHARVETCVFGKTGGWEWVHEHPEEFRKLMEEAK